MKILHFIWSLGMGGAENIVVDIANAQSETNDVFLMIGNAEVDNSVQSRLNQSVSVLRIGRPQGSSNPYWVIKLLVAIRKLKPDVIHLHHCNLAKFGRFLPYPLILTVHTTGVEITNGGGGFVAICCISKAVLDDVHRRYANANPILVENGIVIKSLKQRIGRLQPSFRVVQVSRLDHLTKGQDLLIRALALVTKTWKSGHVLVDFIGDGPSLPYLVSLANTEGVAQQCHFLGATPREKVYSDIGNYDLLVQPSRIEGFGLTIVEAMAAHLSVLVSDVDGPMEVISHGIYGKYFESSNVESLANSLILALSSIDDQEMVDQRNLAYKHVHEKYDVNRTANLYIDIYTGCCGR